LSTLLGKGLEEGDRLDAAAEAAVCLGKENIPAAPSLGEWR
jgi:hypothetical protein